jgi:hypothetical protein
VPVRKPYAVGCANAVRLRAVRVGRRAIGASGTVLATVDRLDRSPPGGEIGHHVLDQRTPKREDALRADAPPAPCPQCGWSTMWNA